MDLVKEGKAAEAAKKLYNILGDKDKQALAVFEQAVEKEGSGQMSDALDLYRRAFKLNDKVDLLYRKTQVPSRLSQLRAAEGKNVGVKLDEDAISKINVVELLQSFQHSVPRPPTEEESVKIVGADGTEVAEVKPISPLIHLDDDVWLNVFEFLLVKEPEAWVNFSLTCKKFAFLGFSTGWLWRKLCHLVYTNQQYEENKLAIAAYTEQHEAEDADTQTPFEVPEDVLPVPKNLESVVAAYHYSWKKMLDTRPFVKFNGCYISVVNYFSEGSKAEFTNSWSNPVKTVTYYRFLRFYPDGKCLKVLTVMEPYRVVPFMNRENTSNSLTAHLDAYKNASYVKEGHRIYHGRWTISTTGEVKIEIEEGSVSYQNFHYEFQVKSSGHHFKFNKLNWIKSYTIRKSMYENAGQTVENSIRNEKPFKFVKVRSYLLDNQAIKKS